MTFFPSIKDDGGLADVFRRFPRGVDPLLVFHDELLRGNSDLSIAERELIAAYVSALNDCGFCFQAHRTYSALYGIDVELFDELVEDVDSSSLEPRLKPLFHYIQKLTKTPSRILQEDVDRVLAAGISEEGLHDAILVVGLFNLMNRIIFGHGVDDHRASYGERLAQVLEAPRDERHEQNEEDLGATPYQEFGRALQQDE
ncbi:MAG: carboxymuconolactone decarboxylase family protein [Persicimonas sp.]